MRDINKELNYCIGLLDGIYNVPKITSVKVSSRMTKTYGRCRTWRYKDDVELTFAKVILDDNYPKNLMYNTIIHELLHAIDHNKSKHGGEWLRMANEVSDLYSFIGNVQRYASDEKQQAREMIQPHKERTRYEIICTSCGAKAWRLGYRAPKWYAHPENFHCKCGGRFKKII